MNTGMIGADPRALREMAATFDAAADTLTSTRTSVQGWVDRADIWRGLDNRQFADGWDTTDSRAIANAAILLRRYSDTLRANAEAQDVTSEAGGSLSGSGLFCAEPTGGSDPHSGAATPSELFEKLHNQDQDSSDGFRIERITGEDGVERFIVYINGTNQGSEGSLTWGEAVASNFGLATKTQGSIRQAMLAAGINGDSEVLYVGYSQGGMIAQNLAASQEFGTGVVLAQGSPRTSATQIGYDVIHINQFGDEVVTGVGLGGIVYDHGNGLHGLVNDKIGYDYVHMPSDLKNISAAAAQDRSSWAHTNMEEYARVTRDFEDSTAQGALKAKAKLAPFLGGIVVSDTK